MLDKLDMARDKLEDFENLAIPQDDHYYYVLNHRNGMLSILNGKYRDAVEHFEHSLEYVSDSLFLFPRYLFASNYNIGKAYFLMHDYDSAIAYIKESEKIALENGLLDMLLEAYKTLSAYYEKAGDEKNAMDYKYRYLHVNDSVFNTREFGKIKDMQSLFELEKIETQVYRLTNEKKLRERMLFIILAALIIIALLLVWASLQNKRLREGNRELFKKNMEVMSSEETERRLRKEYEIRLQEHEARLENYENLLKTQDVSLGEVPEEAADDNGELEDRSRYKKSGLSETHKTSLLELIREVMSDPSEFCLTDFSLDRLASLISSNSAYVSQVINEKLGKNFNAFLSEYRISEARKRLMDFEHYGNLTIEAVAEGLGFKSRSNFIQTFKKITGLTPTEYQKMAKMASNAKSNFQ